MRVAAEFQSTHPRGVRPASSPDVVQADIVSIHAPAWGATCRHPGRSARNGRFNPRTRVGCDLSLTLTMSDLGKFQSTHPRGVRHCGQPAEPERHPVSIHAPAWGATVRGAVLLSFPAGFNPRTRVGCDFGGRVYYRVPQAFQSTHPRGVRLGVDNHSVRSGIVSIHAPAWGATRQERRRRMPRPVSIHAPAWGATQGSASIRSCRNWFQSTHPRGVRLLAALDAQVRQLFQSTHPRGVRLAGAATSFGYLEMFQSTHPRGVRRLPPARFPCLVPSFNPRTRVGCDATSNDQTLFYEMFQSTHPRGVRRVGYVGRQDQSGVSIHAPAWGATTASRIISKTC